MNKNKLKSRLELTPEEIAVIDRGKCPDCAWSQFSKEEAVAMTPCHSCNSTGFITTVIPLSELEEERCILRLRGTILPKGM